jgi:ribosome-binding factor A
VTVTGVQMSPDLRHANVFVTAHGDEERVAAAMAGLDSAKGHIRTLLSQQVSTRYSPELHFRIDPAIEEATRIADAIRLEHASGRVSGDETDADEVIGEDDADV